MSVGYGQYHGKIYKFNKYFQYIIKGDSSSYLMCLVSWLDRMAGAPHHSNSHSSHHNHHQTLFCLLQYSLHSGLLSSACSTCLEIALEQHQLHLGSAEPGIIKFYFVLFSETMSVKVLQLIHYLILPLPVAVLNFDLGAWACIVLIGMTDT